MKTGSTLLKIVGISTLLSVNVQAMVQEYQEPIGTKREAIRIFPQVSIEELALLAFTNVQAKNMYFMELLYKSIVENNSKKIHHDLGWVLKRGFNINVKDHLGNTLLHHAVVVHTGGDVDNILIPLLIGYGADADSKSKAGSTPLCVAAMLGKVEAAKQLIACGADINAKDNFGWSPLEYAIIIDGSVPMVQLLLNIPGINIDQKIVTEALCQRAKRIENLMNVDLKLITENPDLKALFSHWTASFTKLNYMFGAYFSDIQKHLGKASS